MTSVFSVWFLHTCLGVKWTGISLQTKTLWTSETSIGWMLSVVDRRRSIDIHNDKRPLRWPFNSATKWSETCPHENILECETKNMQKKHSWIRFIFVFFYFFCYLAGKQQHDLSVCIEFGVCICLADWMTAMLADGTPHTVGWVSMKFCVCRRTQLRAIGIQQTERISFSCYLAVAVVVIILLLFLCVCVWCAYAM